METILVVDDEAQVRALARDILVGAGYRVLEAADGRAALDVAAAHEGRIDLLVADLGAGRPLLRPTKGEILVDGNGYTLYTFTADSANKSTCTGGCAATWPPVLLTSDTIKVPSTMSGTVGAFGRDSSSIQLTYNGMPLYRYAGDSAPGDARGQGIGGKWYVVSVTG